jgi:hypothetical protein
MKILRLALFVIFVLSMFSCSKETFDPVVIDSNFKASKNDESWVANKSWATYSVKEKKFYINASKQGPGNEIEEELMINFEMQDLTTPLITSAFFSEWLYIVGGDSVSDRYNIDSFGANEIKITSVDTAKKIINGYFSIRMVHDDKYIPKGKSFHYTKGYFSIRYNEIEQMIGYRFPIK